MTVRQWVTDSLKETATHFSCYCQCHTNEQLSSIYSKIAKAASVTVDQIQQVAFERPDPSDDTDVRQPILMNNLERENQLLHQLYNCPALRANVKISSSGGAQLKEVRRKASLLFVAIHEIEPEPAFGNLIWRFASGWQHCVDGFAGHLLLFWHDGRRRRGGRKRLRGDGGGWEPRTLHVSSSALRFGRRFFCRRLEAKRGKEAPRRRYGEFRKERF